MRRIALPLVALALLLSGVALAGGPAFHDVLGEEALGKGELDALSLDGEGVLRPGPAFDALALDAPTAWSAATSGDALWVGTGNTGLLVRVDGQVIAEHDLGDDALLVTAVAPWRDGGAIAAVFPGARLVKASAAGEVETFATLPADHVWGLAPDGRGGLVAATGMPGAVFRIDAFGTVEKVADVGDDHARCLTKSPDGWLVGTAPKGLVLRVAIANGKVDVIRDLEPKEVVGIVALEDGGLLVAANADQAGGNPQQLAGLLNQIKTPTPTKPGQKPAPRASLQDGQVLWIEPSGAVTTLWQAAKVAALALAPYGKGAVLGTYPSGRLFQVAPRQSTRLLADLPEAEASVVLATGEGLPLVVTSNPVVLHRPKETRTRGTWTSAAIDAGSSARWGRIRLLGEGIEALAFRSGETAEPDGTWAEWKPSAGFEGAAGGCGARGRFLQVRVTLEGEDAHLRGLSVAAEAPNRAPVISTLTWKRPGGKKKAVGLPEASPVREIEWKAEDADGDRLQVDLHAQRVGSPRWIPLIAGKVPAAMKHTWDTAGTPDGTYRIRLVVSDAPDTPPTEARTATHVTAPFRIDNTPPAVEVKARVAGDRLLLDGEAVDQSKGRIALVRASVDGGPWHVLGAIDGILDEAAEGFEGILVLPSAGAHDVVVQAWDADGNVGATATVVTVR